MNRTAFRFNINNIRTEKFLIFDINENKYKHSYTVNDKMNVSRIQKY